MPTGERPQRQAGFGYLLLLFVMLFAGAALAAAGERWTSAMQHERETELLFRGLQIREGLGRYAGAVPEGSSNAWPQRLEDLLEDRRGPEPRYWLRQIYADPFDAQGEWQLLRDDQGGIRGVHSRARQPAQRRHALPGGVTVATAGVAAAGEHTPDKQAGAAPIRVGDWHFIAVRETRSAPRSPSTDGAAPRRNP